MELNDNREGSNALFVWGRGGDAQLGHGGLDDVMLPKQVESLIGVTVVKVAAGGKHCVAITRSGDVYSWGWNWSGQLGVGDCADRLQPVLIKSLALAKALNVNIAAGSEHTIAVTDKGEVYTWGGNIDGQLGIKTEGLWQGFAVNENAGIQLQPHLVLSLHLKKVVDVACGGGHTLVLTNEGAVYAWGRANNGRCGTGAIADGREVSITIPKLITKLSGLRNDKVISIACGWSHSMCLTEAGSVYSWGRACDGRLGIGKGNDRVPPDDEYEPVLVEWFAKRQITIKQISGGYYHSAALDVDGNIYTWGWGEHGQLGHGDQNNRYKPKKVEYPFTEYNVAISHVACGGFHTLAITSDGRVFGWGLGEHGQLGIDPPSSAPLTNQLVPVFISSLSNQKTVSVVSGWWHSMAITGKKDPDSDGDGKSGALESDVEEMGKDKEKGGGKGKEKESEGIDLSKSSTGMVADKEFEKHFLDMERKISVMPLKKKRKTLSDYDDEFGSYHNPENEPRSAPNFRRFYDFDITENKLRFTNEEMDGTMGEGKETSKPGPPLVLGTAGNLEGSQSPASPKEGNTLTQLPKEERMSPKAGSPVKGTASPATRVRDADQGRRDSSSRSSPARRSSKSEPQPELTAFGWLATSLANVFFQETLHQKTIDINRKKTQTRIERQKLARKQREQNEIDQAGLVWTEEILPRWEKMYAEIIFQKTGSGF